MLLQNFVEGRWVAGRGTHAALRHAATGATVAETSTEGVDFGAALEYGRRVGGPAMRALTFHQRALMLKAVAQHLMEEKESFYKLSVATGATRADSWIDIEGGIGTFFTYSGKGRRELPDERFYVDGALERISREGTFAARHICVPLEGIAVHINAFNFPCWGMLEKLAPAWLAGMPAIVKPATSTSFLTEAMVRSIISAGIVPEGALQLLCGSAGDLFDHLGCQDVVAFTGSAATGRMLRSHASVIDHSVRFTMEADSLNCSILGPDAAPGTPEFDLYVREVAREMTVKAGQKCTAIRRAIVPAMHADAVAQALSQRLEAVVIGHPEAEGVRMGPLVGLQQREEVRERVAELAQDAEIISGSGGCGDVRGGDTDKGAFIAPVLLRCARPAAASPVHAVEAFGPVCTLMSYDGVDEALDLARQGRGSLVGSLFSKDMTFARDVVLGAAAWHGRLCVVDRESAAESTGHGSPLPQLVHGGPGRAGGGEEMGGIRGVLHYMQRAAIQGSPAVLTAITREWTPGAPQRLDKQHPFRKTFHELEIGDSLVTAKRTVSVDDIEQFAELTGDRFYAHMDAAAARENPFFEDRVAHGYFIVSAAAGLFVDPAPGPVLANYGLDDLRFMAPVYVGDTLEVSFTCQRKTLRHGKDYGEVRWAVTVTNQDGELAAEYAVLTMVST